MFNKDLKAQFIRDCAGSDFTIMKICHSVFSFTENFENVWGADIYTRDAEDLRPIFSHLTGVRANRYRRVIILRRYLIWCYSNGIEGARDEYKKVEMPEIDDMKKKTVISSKQLQNYLDQIFEPEGEQMVDNVLRCFCWLAFIGVDKTKVMEVQASDVDLIRRKVYFNNGEYNICREAMPAFRNCVTLTKFAKIEANGRISFRDRVNTGHLLRGIRKLPAFDTLATTLSDVIGKAYNKGYINKRLSYDRIWLSGLFCRTYSREVVGDIVDFSDVAALYHNSREQKRATAIYTFDYEVWKATFE